MTELVTPRGHKLALVTLPVEGACIVTVELYVKWYELWLVACAQDHWTLESVPLFHNEYEQIAARLGMSAAVDHVPNPEVVRAWCDEKGYELDALAEELMVGRWRLEVES